MHRPMRFIVPTATYSNDATELYTKKILGGSKSKIVEK